MAFDIFMQDEEPIEEDDEMNMPVEPPPIEGDGSDDTGMDAPVA